MTGDRIIALTILVLPTHVKKALFALVAAMTLAAPLAQGEGPIDETRFTLREQLLRLINRDRKQFGLSPVALDAFASTVADNYCREQIREGVSGHFGLNGESPYMRYSFAGGNDGISENTAAWSASYNFGARALYEMMHRSEDEMMNEVAPHDGHRRAILDPNATHVGIGMAWERGEFRLAEEFVRRYVTWSKELPRIASVSDAVLCGGKPAPGYTIDAVSVHYEPLPAPISAAVANKIETYRLPDKRHDYMPQARRRFRRLVATGMKGAAAHTEFVIGTDGAFSFHVPFTDGRGVYTVVVWVQKNGDSAPIPASNVSIKVQDVAQVSYSSR